MSQSNPSDLFPPPPHPKRCTHGPGNLLLGHLAVITLLWNPYCLPDGTFLACGLDEISRRTEAAKRVGYMLAGVYLGVPVAHVGSLALRMAGEMVYWASKASSKFAWL